MSTKPGVHSKTVSTGQKIAVDSNLAARLGVSSTRLDQALRAVKTSLSKANAKPTEDQFDAALARSLGIPQARVRQAFPVGEPRGSKPATQPGNEALAAAVARELHVSTARVNAALRPMFAVGRADPSSAAHQASRRGMRLSLTKTEFALLELFLRNPGRVLSRTQIFESVLSLRRRPTGWRRG